jgi:eukaryotic-like serine/threonine-protein kinase
MTRLLGGRYDLQEQIGGGGMALVYRAVDTLLGRQVAVKMLRSQFSGDEEIVSRFRREAQSAASLSHTNIVNLYDVGVTDGNEYYIVMEYVDGPTLKEVIRERGPLPVAEVIGLTSQICDALEQAHARNIVHRDIKPHNILLTKSGHVKVTDFGIARAISGNTITHQYTQSVLGSVHYLSPEQARGGATDYKSDIYSLGIVMYEMLTKQLPFSGDSPVSVALKHLRESFVEPRELNRDVPQSVENIILRCLAKSPDDRYPNMLAVKADLEDALVHPNVPKFVLPTVVSDETIAIPAVGGPWQRTEQDRRKMAAEETKGKRKWWSVALWSGVAFAVLCVGIIAAYYIVIDLIQVPNLHLPDVRGKTEAQALGSLKSAGFTVNQIQEKKASNAKPAGTVYDQDPEGPMDVKKGRDITLYVSTGPLAIPMPDLTGEPVDQAIQTLITLGISKDNIDQQTVQTSDVNSDVVVGTTPDKGASMTTDSKIVLKVSKNTMTTVPDIIGKSLTDATAALQAANLTPGAVTRAQYPGQDGTVFKIVPVQAGQQVPAGTAIGLYVIDNSGEGGGTGTTNSPDGSGGPNPPANESKTETVTVNDPSHKRLHVTVYITDAVSTKTKQVDEVITASKSWPVTAVVTPDTPGEIDVYVNGVLQKSIPVTYS